MFDKRERQTHGATADLLGRKKLMNIDKEQTADTGTRHLIFLHKSRTLCSHVLCDCMH